MTGAVQVLALSDDEDDINCTRSTPRSQTLPRSRPGIRQCTPITPGDVVCLDSDDEPELEGRGECTPATSVKISEPVQLENPSSSKLNEDLATGQCTPATATKAAELLQQAFQFEDCCTVRQKSSSSLKRPNLSLLDECCIVKETPSSSSRVPPRAPLIDLDSNVFYSLENKELTTTSETRIKWADSLLNQRKKIEIFSIKNMFNQIPLEDEDHTLLEVPMEVERQGKRQKSINVAPSTGSRGDVDLNVETRNGTEEGTCCGGSQRSTLRGQKISEEERQIRLRLKEVEFERKQAEKAEKKREKEEAKKQQQEEIRQRKEAEKIRKSNANKEAQEKRKHDLEMEKQRRGKYALKNMTAVVDTKVAEKGHIGGQLFSRFDAKQMHYQCVKNPLANSIIWLTKRPSSDNPEIVQSQDTEVFGSQGESMSSQLVLEEVEIQYLAFVFGADEFSTMVAESSLFSHVREAQHQYPGYTICYVVNKLMSFLEKKDQAQYKAKGPANTGERWQRPYVEKALAGLMTNFKDVHSRLCIDEADVADHLSGLMRTLAEFYFKPKVTRLSVSKNGDHVKDDAFKEEIRKSLWLKALVAIPKVSGPCAMSIGKVYPSMRSLLKVYLDKNKTVSEKELLLQDLQRESIFSSAGQRIGPVSSRQIYRILMAEDGNLKVDKIQEGHQG